MVTVGEKEDDLITSFRCELRAALLVATAKGTAEMLTVAGRPFRKGAAQGSSAWPGARAFAQRAAEDGAEDTAVGDSAPNEKEKGEYSLVGDVDSDGSDGSNRQSCNDSGVGTDVPPPPQIRPPRCCSGCLPGLLSCVTPVFCYL